MITPSKVKNTDAIPDNGSYRVVKIDGKEV